MTGTPHSHVGFCVANLEEAMKDFSAVLGVTFNEPVTVFFNRLEDPEPRESTLRVTFSKEGPPHYELIESTGTGIHSLPAGEGVHHVGIWEPDTHNRMKELEAMGYRSDARVVMPDGTVLSWFNDPEQLHGVRFEFVDDGGRTELEHFMKTGEYDGEFRV